jgi:hypothetical protein
MGMTALLTAVLLAQDASILEKFASARPKDEDLLAFKLDWTDTLKAAKEKARQEGRPIVMFLIGTKTGYGDLYRGHC